MNRKLAAAIFLLFISSAAFSQSTIFAAAPTITLSPSSAAAYGNLGGGGIYDAVSLTSSALEVYLAGSTSPVIYPLSTGCTGANNVAIEDANNDGKNDVVVTCVDAVDVFLNKGSGVLGAAQELDVADAFSSFAVGDLNNDGLPDLVYVVAYGPHVGDIAVVGNTGSGSTAPIYAAIGGNAMSIAIGDVNGDGYADVVTLGNDLAYLLNQHGTGLAPAQHIAGPQAQPYTASQVAVADVNGDGIADIVAGGAQQTFVILGNKSGTLAVSSTYLVDDASGDPYVLIDLNGDGYPDIFANEGATFIVQLNDGKGNFTAPTRYLAAGYPATFLDLNGDGKPDILYYAAGSPYPAYVNYNNGDGTFASPLATPRQPYSLPITADFNGDGLLDTASLIVNDQTGQSSVDVQQSVGDGSFQDIPVFTPAIQSPYSLSLFASDLTGDGKQDIAVIGTTLTYNETSKQYTGTVEEQSCLNTGSGLSFRCNSPVVVYTGSGYNASAYIADIDGDGIPDVLILNSGSPAYYAKGLGNGTFASATSLGFTPSSSGNVFVGHFGSGGNQDILIGNTVYLRQSSGTYTSGTVFAYTPLTVADINGGGYLDVICNGYSNGAILYVNQAGNSFTPVTLPSPGPDYSPTVAAVGDVNGDGNPDIVVAYQGFGSGEASANLLYVMLNNGSGGFPAASDVVPLNPASGGPDALTLGVLNGSAAKPAKGSQLDLLVGAYTAPVAMLNQLNTQPVRKKLARTNFSLSPNPVREGNNVSIAIAAGAATGSAVPTGTVSLWENAQVLTTATLSGGKAALNAPTSGIAQGNYNLLVRYSGDANFEPVSSNLVSAAVEQSAIPTLTYASFPIMSVAPGQEVTAYADVVPAAGAGVPTGNVKFVVYSGFSVSPILTATASLQNGRASLSGNIPSGFAQQDIYFIAYYLGGGGFAPSNSINNGFTPGLEVEPVPIISITSGPATASPGTTLALAGTVQYQRTTTSGPPLDFFVNNLPVQQSQVQYAVGGGDSGLLNWTATITVPQLKAGNYNVSASTIFSSGPVVYSNAVPLTVQ